MRKVHSAWDRTKREWAGLVAQSEAHTNTKGCKFESDLRASILIGTKIDDSMVALETNYVAKGALARDEIEQGAKFASQLMEAMKNGGKRVVALRACFKVWQIRWQLREFSAIAMENGYRLEPDDDDYPPPLSLPPSLPPDTPHLWEVSDLLHVYATVYAYGCIYAYVIVQIYVNIYIYTYIHIITM